MRSVLFFLFKLCYCSLCAPYFFLPLNFLLCHSFTLCFIGSPSVPFSHLFSALPVESHHSGSKALCRCAGKSQKPESGKKVKREEVGRGEEEGSGKGGGRIKYKVKTDRRERKRKRKYSSAREAPQQRQQQKEGRVRKQEKHK